MTGIPDARLLLDFRHPPSYLERFNMSTRTVPNPGTNKQLVDKVTKLEDRLAFEAQLRTLMNRMHEASNIDEILIFLKNDILNLFQVERATIFAVDDARNELYSKAKHGDEIEEIRVPISEESLVGWSVKTKEMLTIRDAYDAGELSSIDHRLKFNQSFDQKTKFRTRAVLVAPVRHGDAILGAVQLINKRSGEFSSEDQNGAREIGKTLGVAFANQRKMAVRRRPSKFDWLLQNGILTEMQLEEAVKMARNAGAPIEQILMTHLKVKKPDLGTSLSAFYRCDFFQFDPNLPIPGDLLEKLEPEYLKDQGWCPITRRGDALVVAIDDPRHLQKLDDLRQRLKGEKFIYQVALREDVAKVVDLFFKTHAVEQFSMDSILTELEEEHEAEKRQEDGGEEPDENDSAIVKLVNKIILDAHQLGSSDIHIEPYSAKPVMVRYRIDGDCEQKSTIPGNFRRAVVSRIKIMAGLDIAEHRKPQDGKIRFRLEKDREIELRVATLPTQGGNEDVVMRILAASEPIPMDQLKLSDRNLQALKVLAQKPYGLILVVGPTGSGKTTTLHSVLGHINTPDRKIWTAEDPVEITQIGLRQVQVQAKIGLTFAASMRAFLRADPDVIMVGEMRDEETAATGIEASLTGHLVLSTLHTNNAPETVTRLLDMGLDPFTFSDSLLGVLAQRLTRSLCGKCKEAYQPTAVDWDRLAEEYGREYWGRMEPKPAADAKLYRKGKGCDACRQQGYKGRMAVHELMLNTDEVRTAIQRKQTVDELWVIALKQGMRTLKQDGIEKVIKGATDLDQILAVCSR